jgi:hypothetical protein
MPTTENNQAVTEEKKHIGTVCGHHEEIEAEGDAYCVEFEDGLGDVCEECFCGCESIHDDCSEDEAGEPDEEGDIEYGVNNPYQSGLSDYWYKGTIEEFKKEIAE